MSFGDWSDFTPENIKSYSEAKLLYAMTLNKGGVYDAWAMNELQRRHFAHLSNLIGNLAEINDKSAQEVKRLVESSLTIEKLTKRLVQLTKRLVFLTVALSFLTLVLVVDVAIKFQHEYFSPPPPLTAPQTPTPTPR